MIPPSRSPRSDSERAEGSVARRTSPQSRSQPAQHVCFCGKSYVRKEHLRRHQAIHDGMQQHTCTLCGAKFARKDMLRRHVQEHSFPGDGRRSKACEACRASKTKCDRTIGTQCSLCRRRGFDCRYVDDKSRTRPSPADPQPPQAPAKEPEAAQISSGAVAPEVISIEDDDNSVASCSQSYGTADLESLLENISKGIGGPPENLRILNGSASMQAVIDKVWEAYLEKFHPLWPIIHAPTFDFREQPFDICTIVCLVGAYCLDSAVSSLELSIISRTHEKMMDSFLHNLCTGPNLNADLEPWPFTKYQSILITIIFATYLGEEIPLQKARRLTDLLITSLRAAGFFCSETAKMQNERHFPGSFPPWRFVIGQNQSRIVAHLFKIDAHLGVISQQPPAIRPSELEVPLPSTFSQVNGYSLDVYQVRHTALQHVRKETAMASFLENPTTTFGSRILIEDVHIGLCGLAAQAWQLAQIQRADSDSGSAACLYGKLVHSLRFWRGHLQTLRAAVGQDRLLRAAYYDGEERPDEVIRSILDETLAVYHLLSLLVNTQAPSNISVNADTMESHNLSRTSLLPAQGMRSVFHAVCIGALNLASKDCCRPPMLQQARIFAQEYVASLLENSCWCTFANSKVDLALADAQIEQEDDVCGMPLGKFWFFVEGQPLCACGRNTFLAKVGLLEEEG